MAASLMIRRGLFGFAVGLAALIAAAAAFATAVNAGYFHSLLVRMVAARLGRSVEVSGSLDAQIFSAHPQVNAARVTIGNPPWVSPGITAEIGELSLVLVVPWFHRSFGIERLSMRDATFHLQRDASGRANWQWSNPDAAPSTKKLPILRALSVPDAHVLLKDDRRHLVFDGIVSAQGPDALENGGQPLRIEGKGQLNGRAASFEVDADPLGGASHERPYHFSYSESSSGTQLTGQGSLPRPFDFDEIDARFEAAGADIEDLYFLTGVKLINTGGFHLSGRLVRHGLQSEFSELAASTGQSDMHGRVSIDSSGDRPKLDVDLNSKFLRMADLGARAAGRAPDIPASAQLLLSTAALNPATVRRGDARMMFHAQRVEIGRVPLDEVSAQGTIDHGVLTVTPLTAQILDGKLEASVKLDARTDPPIVHADIRIADLQLALIPHKSPGPAPVEGLMQVRASLTGRGSSVHQFAAGANGTLTAVVPAGAVRDSLAELAGIDLRGLGLLLAGNQRETTLRCAYAAFEDRDGTLTAKTILADTDPVLISGGGQIHLDSETLDLAIRGHPKSLRLFRFDSPVLLKGTLSHPSIQIEPHRLKVVDPGRARDADCAALIADFNSQGE
jgi:uncharacterized protein involved in outer membrane biogenesis